jgi:hypothetical protein
VVLYEKFRRDDTEEHFTGADELIALDSINGLLVVLETIGGWMETHPEYCVDDVLLKQAEEALGPEARAAARAAAEESPRIRRSAPSPVHPCPIRAEILP